MADFDPAVRLVFRHEGGYVWNKNDPGGATSMGITLAVLQDWRKKPVTPADVQALTVAEAKAIYQAHYWAAIGGEHIACQDVANWCLDLAVLRGAGNAVKAMQQALGQKADGLAGANTIAALNKADPAVFLNVFRSICVRAFGAIVTGRPASLEFLNNWLRRAEEMTDTVSVLTQRTPAQGPAAAAPLVAAKT